MWCPVILRKCWCGDVLQPAVTFPYSNPPYGSPVSRYCKNMLLSVNVNIVQNHVSKAKKVNKNMLSAKVNNINLDITVDYFIFHHCLLSKGEARHSILHVDASSVAVAECRSKVCVLLEQDK